MWFEQEDEEQAVVLGLLGKLWGKGGSITAASGVASGGGVGLAVCLAELREPEEEGFGLLSRALKGNKLGKRGQG